MSAGRVEGRVEGRVAVITGASSGIGAATAGLLAAQGARVVLVARREARLAELAGMIGGGPERVLAAPADVTDRSRMEEVAAAALDAFGRIDVLVNNAGVMPLSPLADLRVDDWEWMVRVNVLGVLYALAAVLPAMLEQGGGHVVNVGSVAGRRPFPGGSVYSATKFAVRALSAGIHKELSASKQIRVTDIEPGVVDTELADHIPTEEMRAGFEARWEGKRKLTAEDVARAILYAVSAPARVNVNEILVRPTDQET